MDGPHDSAAVLVGPFQVPHSRLRASSHPAATPAATAAETERDRSQSARKALVGSGKRSTSEFKGVNLHARSNRWEAHIWDGHQVHVGCFDSELQAAVAYDLVALRFRGDRAKLNFAAAEYREEQAVLDKLTKDQVLKVMRGLPLERQDDGSYWVAGVGTPSAALAADPASTQAGKRPVRPSRRTLAAAAGPATPTKPTRKHPKAAPHAANSYSSATTNSSTSLITLGSLAAARTPARKAARRSPKASPRAAPVAVSPLKRTKRPAPQGPRPATPSPSLSTSESNTQSYDSLAECAPPAATPAACRPTCSASSNASDPLLTSHPMEPPSAPHEAASDEHTDTDLYLEPDDDLMSLFDGLSEPPTRPPAATTTAYQTIFTCSAPPACHTDPCTSAYPHPYPYAPAYPHHSSHAHQYYSQPEHPCRDAHPHASPPCGCTAFRAMDPYASALHAAPRRSPTPPIAYPPQHPGSHPSAHQPHPTHPHRHPCHHPAPAPHSAALHPFCVPYSSSPTPADPTHPHHAHGTTPLLPDFLPTQGTVFSACASYDSLASADTSDGAAAAAAAQAHPLRPPHCPPQPPSDGLAGLNSTGPDLGLDLMDDLMLLDGPDAAPAPAPSFAPCLGGLPRSSDATCNALLLQQLLADGFDF